MWQTSMILTSVAVAATVVCTFGQGSTESTPVSW